MNVLFLGSEVAPWSKTGGLGDVLGALPEALARRGHEVHVVTPRYGPIEPRRAGLTPTGVTVEIGGERAGLLAPPARSGGAQVLFLEHERFFGGRVGLYHDGWHDYPDNAQRFAFFCRAALEVPRALGFAPDVVSLHDWQSALGAWILRHERQDAWAPAARSIYTIHNLAYQGVFPKHVLPELGIPWSAFSADGFEFYDQVNFMKGGLVFADAITTVSPTYAREILTPEQGCALDGVLRAREARLTGILNGIDELAWDPSRDPNLAASFGPADLAGKATCKRALQEQMGLPARREVPLVAMVGRLAEQKGLELVAAALPQLLGADVQLVLLGSGEKRYEELFARAARELPSKLAVRIGFDERLAHRIEAGADLFLMPSRFEPCGLNQMYSLRYGTVPVVHAVGGLDDTVEDYDGFRSGTGFKFAGYDPAALLTAVRRALDVFRDARAWAGIVARGMAQDNSWRHAAATYEALFERVRAAPPAGR